MLGSDYTLALIRGLPKEVHTGCGGLKKGPSKIMSKFLNVKRISGASARNGSSCEGMPSVVGREAWF